MQQGSVPVPAPLGIIHQEKDIEGTFIRDMATVAVSWDRKSGRDTPLDTFCIWTRDNNTEG